MAGALLACVVMPVTKLPRKATMRLNRVGNQGGKVVRTSYGRGASCGPPFASLEFDAHRPAAEISGRMGWQPSSAPAMDAPGSGCSRPKLKPGGAKGLFKAFHTTEPGCWSMGLSICRSSGLTAAGSRWRQTGRAAPFSGLNSRWLAGSAAAGEQSVAPSRSTACEATGQTKNDPNPWDRLYHRIG